VRVDWARRKQGIFITASTFTKETVEYTAKNETKIILIDGIQSAELMIEYNRFILKPQVSEQLPPQT
jgi:restriction system protein